MLVKQDIMCRDGGKQADLTDISLPSLTCRPVGSAVNGLHPVEDDLNELGPMFASSLLPMTHVKPKGYNESICSIRCTIDSSLV